MYSRRIRDGVAEEPGHAEDELGLDEALERFGQARVADEQDRDEHRGQGRQAERQPSIQALADGVDRDEDAESRLEGHARRQDPDLDDGRADDEEHHFERVSPAHDEGQALQQQQEHGHGVGRSDARSAAQVRQERDRGEPEGDRHVDRVDVDRHRAPKPSHPRSSSIRKSIPPVLVLTAQR